MLSAQCSAALNQRQTVASGQAREKWQDRISCALEDNAFLLTFRS